MFFQQKTADDDESCNGGVHGSPRRRSTSQPSTGFFLFQSTKHGKDQETKRSRRHASGERPQVEKSSQPINPEGRPSKIGRSKKNKVVRVGRRNRPTKRKHRHEGKRKGPPMKAKEAFEGTNPQTQGEKKKKTEKTIESKRKKKKKKKQTKKKKYQVNKKKFLIKNTK
ncbi:hypothetical protein IQ274_32805 [Nostoc sp. LEGE 12447]|uniref:hypothetical protein n=1 Tax=Nostoc sp. LEGE 12447 TaxID=1828640 RepID=UPI0018840D20|nr:hypothetical protein [Nostoc sp. LEGE 12447]MBE9002837.1 hypothetical protein [Nostoc sp. LEGE 12447]